MAYVIKRTEVDVIGWKYVYRFLKQESPPIYGLHGIEPEVSFAKLYIPEGTLVGAYENDVDPDGWEEDSFRKLRAEKVFCVGFYNKRKKKEKGNFYYCSQHDVWFSYQEQEVILPLEGFSKELEECDSGIHFFLSFEEAKNYAFF